MITSSWRTVHARIVSICDLYSVPYPYHLIDKKKKNEGKSDQTNKQTSNRRTQGGNVGVLSGEQEQVDGHLLRCTVQRELLVEIRGGSQVLDILGRNICTGRIRAARRVNATPSAGLLGNASIYELQPTECCMRLAQVTGNVGANLITDLPLGEIV